MWSRDFLGKARLRHGTLRDSDTDSDMKYYFFFWNYHSQNFVLANTISKHWTEPTVRKLILAYVAQQHLTPSCLEKIRKMAQKWNNKNIKNYSTKLNVEFKRNEPVQTRSQVKRLRSGIFEILRFLSEHMIQFPVVNPYQRPIWRGNRRCFKSKKTKNWPKVSI